jgi:predicted GIY-YIG superfamily endonuclease
MSAACYLLHFDRPYRHAQHYLGWAEDVARRLAEHQAGRAQCRLTGAAAAAGVRFVAARVWDGGRDVEARLKRRASKQPHPDGRRTGSASSWRSRCPICREEATQDV